MEDICYINAILQEAEGLFKTSQPHMPVTSVPSRKFSSAATLTEIWNLFPGDVSASLHTWPGHTFGRLVIYNMSRVLLLKSGLNCVIFSHNLIDKNSLNNFSPIN